MIGYLAIFSCALAGFAGAPIWTIAAAAIALAAISYAEHAALYDRGRELGLTNALNAVLLRSAFNAVTAAALAYVGGWAFRWL